MIKKFLVITMVLLSLGLVSAQSTGDLIGHKASRPVITQRTPRQKKPLPVSFALFIKKEYNLNYIQDFGNLHKYCSTGQLFGAKNTFNVESCNNVFGDYLRDFNDSLRFINNPLSTISGLINDKRPRSDIKTFINSLIANSKQTDGSVHEDLVKGFLVLGTLKLDYNYYKSLSNKSTSDTNTTGTTAPTTPVITTGTTNILTGMTTTGTIITSPSITSGSISSGSIVSSGTSTNSTRVIVVPNTL